MNRDNKLPFPEQLPDAPNSSDTIKVNNRASPSQQQQQTPRLPLANANYRPTGQDIICGRGRGSFSHEGNQVYLSLLRRNAHAYVGAKKRVEKSAIISTIVSSLKESGFRFLKQEDKNKRWYELSQQECYDRTAHAIRDLIRKQKGRNKKPPSQYASRSPSPSDSDISVDSHEKHGYTILPTSFDTLNPLTSIFEQSIANQQLSSPSSGTLPSYHVASLPQATINTANLKRDADSFDEEISEIPPEVMSPTDRLKTGGFDAFFELEPDDFKQVLSQLDTEKQERRASWESK
ncbi:unnamed protein product [Cylindrotheca closterium]|uniref:DUF6824 domain-containing protein n=1 Tax=Cylindrotheca closterium TaxID=2856 RepID=A0AAD2CGZ3_9STRA|nr:unnamed protein product [Cylindrotheca closterium]